MNQQINIRLPEKLLSSARLYAEKHGFGTMQDFIKETLREKLFEDVSKKELALVNKLIEVSEKKKLYGTEKELFAKNSRESDYIVRPSYFFLEQLDELGEKALRIIEEKLILSKEESIQI